MPIANSGLEPRTVSRSQCFLAFICDEHDPSLQHVYKLVFVRVPVALARPDTCGETEQVHPKLSQPRCLTESPPRSVLAGLVERGGGTRARTLGRNELVDFGHFRLSLFMGLS